MANSNTTQALAVGEVKSTKGEVFAQDADGHVRRLSVGDKIFEGEVIVTANGSSAEINMFNAPALNLTEQQSVVIDTQVASVPHDTTAGAVSNLGSTEAAKVIQTVATGDQNFNALLEQEAAAAGLTGGDAGGGNSFVDLMRIVETVPTTSYAFPTNPTGTPPTIEGQGGVPVLTETTVAIAEVKADVVLPQGGDGSAAIVSGSNVYIPEGTNGEASNIVTFILRLDHASTQDVTVTYEIKPGTAQEGVDYSGTLTGKVIIPAGTTEIPVTVNIVPDHLDDQHWGMGGSYIVDPATGQRTRVPDGDSAVSASSLATLSEDAAASLLGNSVLDTATASVKKGK